MDKEKERSLALAYRPRLLFDKREPFPLLAVGYGVYSREGRSLSFPSRMMVPLPGGTVIEYAFWYDYDIQHLYELEQIWVYLDREGNVKEAQGSFHGKYLRLVEPHTNRIPMDENQRVMAYVQPGKHALMPDPDLFRLFCGAKRCCMEEAGAEGIAPGWMVRERYKDVSPELQERTKAYIRSHYAFVPSFSFEEKPWDPALLMPWEDLMASIPERMDRQIRLIKEWEGENP